MKFRYVSDIHNEFYTSKNTPFWDFELESHVDDIKSTLILGGDIGILDSPYTYSTLLKNVCERFKYVFWIAGNHEFYHGNVSKHSVSKAIDDLKIPNLFTDQMEVEGEDIVILGGTFWTDFANENPLAMMEAQAKMNDYRLIRKGDSYSKLLPQDTYAMHIRDKRRIFNAAADYKNRGWKVVIVTHHHPSYQGIDERYKSDSTNPAYCSALDAEIADLKPDYWICGHIHRNQTYTIGDTIVVSNPVGYLGEICANYNAQANFII